MSMKRLGSLGRDLGEIVEHDLRRIDRGRAAEDYPHTALAAQDLATRLRLPDPSFGSRGGGPSQAGGESGGKSGKPGNSGSGGEGEASADGDSEVAEALNSLASEGTDPGDDGSREAEGSAGNSSGSQRTDIPGAEQHTGPQEFRKRVVRGLGEPSGKYQEAVRRYAEDLLR